MLDDHIILKSWSILDDLIIQQLIKLYHMKTEMMILNFVEILVVEKRKPIAIIMK